MKADEISAFLDRELDVGAFEDSSQNGLQVGRRGSVKKVCCGVDASMEFFQEAQRRGADFLICHHGISWGDSLKRITGLNYERISFLMEHDMALYACHLPLDAHPRYGNNVLLARALGLKRLRPFGMYGGREIGFQGSLESTMAYTALKARVRKVAGNELRTMDFGKQRVKNIAVVSGGAADEVVEAGEKQVDVYVTGEPKLMAYSLAQEYGINVIFAGHYATEVFGVIALGQLLKRRFGLSSEFVDLKVTF